MRLLVKTRKETPDDMLPYLVDHGSDLLQLPTTVLRGGVPDETAARWMTIEVPATGGWTSECGIRCIAALAFEVLLEGDAFLLDESGRPRPWPQGQRDREMRDWILEPPSESTDYIVPEADFDHASLRVDVDRELGGRDIELLRRVLGSKLRSPSGGIPERSWHVEDGSTTVRVVYHFHYWEPGHGTWDGFDQWCLAAACIEAWTGGTVAWCAADCRETMKFDKPTRDTLLWRWPFGQTDNIRHWCQELGRKHVTLYGEERGRPADIVAAEEHRVLLRFVESPSREVWFPYYRIKHCF